MIRRYVAFEGIDGAGKTTVARLVAEQFRAAGEDVVFFREPGGTPVGEEIRHVLLDPSGTMAAWPEAMLFAAQRAQLAVDVIAPALADGRIVVSDRSVYSSLAYQGGARGLGIEAVRRVNAAASASTGPNTSCCCASTPRPGWTGRTAPTGSASRAWSSSNGWPMPTSNSPPPNPRSSFGSMHRSGSTPWSGPRWKP